MPWTPEQRRRYAPAISDTVCANATVRLATGRRGSAAEGWLRTLREAEEKSNSQAAAGLHSDQVPIHPLRLCAVSGDLGP